MFDTGKNMQERLDTLVYQQEQLLAGTRSVQMFPTGTLELGLPMGMERVRNERGEFHFNPVKISRNKVLLYSLNGRENEILNLGPFSKDDVLDRIGAGDDAYTVLEVTPKGVEVRASVGSTSTIGKQRKYFEDTKIAGNEIRVERVSDTLMRRVNGV